MPKKGLDHAEPYDSPLYKSQTKLDNDGGDDLVYVGHSSPKVKSSEPLWQIMKLIYSSGTLVGVQFADQNNTASKIWNDRATYSYDPDA